MAKKLNEMANFMLLASADALGSATNGMSRGHIHAHFPHIDTYPDPREAWKDHPERWKKPGLYSYITQLSLLALIAAFEKRSDEHFMVDLAGRIFTNPESWELYFRYTDPVMTNFFAGLAEGHLDPTQRPGASPLVVSLMFSLHCFPKKSNLQTIAAFARLFSHNSDVLAALLVCDALIRELPYSQEGYLDTASRCASNLKKSLPDELPAFFRIGVLPDQLEASVQGFSDLFALLQDEEDDKEEALLRYFNRDQKNPVKRATVDNVLLIFPKALLVADSALEGEELLDALRAGGETALLTPLVALITAERRNHLDLVSFLGQDLMNKKSVGEVAQKLQKGKFSAEEARLFFEGEKKLSAKYLEELKALSKHNKKADKKPKKEQRKTSRKHQEEVLSRHVVESWTKQDKARWKKERRKGAPDLDEDDYE